MKQAITVGLGLVLAAAMYLAASSYVNAQEDNQRGRRGEGMRQGDRPGGPGGRFDPERMREMMAQRMKQVLNCTDEEYEIVGPRLEKVMELQMRNRFMGRRGMRGPGGPGGPGGGPMMGEQNPEADALQRVLADEDASADTIKAKLEAFRAAKKKDEAELDTAKDKLREVLSIRQEAQLVLMGTLD